MSVSRSAVEFFGTLSLFQGLDEGDLGEIAKIAENFCLAPAQTLFRQGATSDGIYFIRDGAIQVCARVPGDEVVTLARLGPGSVLGEVALLNSGARSATALGIEETTGYWLGRRHFEFLRKEHGKACRLITDRLIETTCTCLRQSYGRIASLLDPSTPRSAEKSPISDGLTEVDARDFPFASLPFFTDLSARNLDVVLSAGRVLSLQRGRVLYRQGAPRHEVFVVLRGALRTTLNRMGGRFQVSVLGPGSIDGALSAVDSKPNAVSSEACEASHVLGLPRHVVQELRASDEPLSSYLSERLHEQLVHDLRQCTENAVRLELERHLSSRSRELAHV